MTATVLPFARPAHRLQVNTRDYSTLHCMFCHTEHLAVFERAQQYHPCPGCDETAAVPLKEFLK